MQAVLQTERLVLREFTLDDAAFIFEIMNEPDWLRFIGDRNLKTVEDARAFLESRLIPAYQELGFGFYAVLLKENDAYPIGMCGLVKREFLEDVDIGFAVLKRFEGKGLMSEAAKAVLAMALDELGLRRVVAMTNLDNIRSMRLLERIGLRFERVFQPPDEEQQLRLFAWEYVHDAGNEFVSSTD